MLRMARGDKEAADSQSAEAIGASSGTREEERRGEDEADNALDASGTQLQQLAASVATVNEQMQEVLRRMDSMEGMLTRAVEALQACPSALPPRRSPTRPLQRSLLGTRVAEAVVDLTDEVGAGVGVGVAVAGPSRGVGRGVRKVQRVAHEASWTVALSTRSAELAQLWGAEEGAAGAGVRRLGDVEVQVQLPVAAVTRFTPFAHMERLKEAVASRMGLSWLDVRLSTDPVAEGRDHLDGIRDGAEVFVSRRRPRRRPFAIKVRAVSGEQHELLVDLADTVRELKYMLEKASGTPMARQRLIFRGQQLVDDSALARYKLEEAHVIHLVQNIQ